MTGGGNYTYKYKTDKFGNYSIETSNIKNPFGLSGAYADNLSDINTILYAVPVNKSSYGRTAYVDGHIVNAELTDRNFYLVLEIPGPLSPSTDGNQFEDGEIVRANGHITIKEIDGEVELTKGMLGDNRVTVIEIDGEETSRRAVAMG